MSTAVLERPAIFSRATANTSQASTIAGVHLNTIYAWVRDNRVEYVRTPTGQIRIYVDTLLRHDRGDATSGGR